MLSEDAVFAAASEWSSLRSRIEPGCVVGAGVASTLRWLDIDLPWTPLALTTLLEHELPDDLCVSPSLADALGKVLTGKLVDKLRQGDRDYRDEHDKLREVLDNVKFRGEDGNWHVASGLLTAHPGDPRHAEERRRADLSPPENRLDGKYANDAATQFFLACRGRMRADAEQLARWVIRAEGHVDRQKAALRYLNEGELAVSVQDSLAEIDIQGTWLEDVPAVSGLLDEFDEDTAAVIGGRLRQSRQLREHDRDQDERTPARNAAAVVCDIYAWWDSNRKQVIQEYEQRVYPDGVRPPLDLSGDLEALQSSADSRRGWMTLFMLGAMRTIGRTKPEQHRGFVERFEQKGWLDKLIDPECRADDWFRIVEEYLQTLVDVSPYFSWMGQLLSYYQLARWLPEYSMLFQGVTRSGVGGENVTLGDVTSPRTSPLFDRASGFDVPPPARTLGMGACFVLREVVRARAAEAGTAGNRYRPNHGILPYCYVPSLRVRRLFAAITGDPLDQEDRRNSWERSVDIHGMLREHLGDGSNFDYAFDIPFFVLTLPGWQGQREQLLGSGLDEAAFAVEGDIDCKMMLEPVE